MYYIVQFMFNKLICYGFWFRDLMFSVFHFFSNQCNIVTVFFAHEVVDIWNFGTIFLLWINDHVSCLKPTICNFLHLNMYYLHLKQSTHLVIKLQCLKLVCLCVILICWDCFFNFTLICYWKVILESTHK